MLYVVFTSCVTHYLVLFHLKAILKNNRFILIILLKQTFFGNITKKYHLQEILSYLGKITLQNNVFFQELLTPLRPYLHDVIY